MGKPQESRGTLNPFTSLPSGLRVRAYKGHRPNTQREDFEVDSSYIIKMCGELRSEMGGLTPDEAVEEFDQLLKRIRARKSFTEVVPQWREKAKRFYRAHRRLAQLMDAVHRWGMPTLSIMAIETNIKENLSYLHLEKAEEQLQLLHEVASEKVGYYI